MSESDRAIIVGRLHSHGLLAPRHRSPEAAVGWSLAVQAQDYPGAKWSLGQRVPGATDAGIDRLVDAGRILRTHVLRPTWHLALPEDLRWLLRLTAPRVHAANRGRYRDLELDEATRGRGREAIQRALADAGPLPRAAVGEALAAADIDPAGQRLAYLLMDAELEAVIVSGPLRNGQQTYALFDDRVPPPPARDREEQLATLVERYVASHGPVTAHDIAWWSGLTVTDIRRGLALVADRLEAIEIDGASWWRAPGTQPAAPEGPLAHLLQPWDEYLLPFRAPNPVWPPAARAEQHPRGAFWNAGLIVVDGLVRGGWRRKVTAREARVTPILPEPLGPEARPAVEAAVAAWGRFLERPATIEWAGP